MTMATRHRWEEVQDFYPQEDELCYSREQPLVAGNVWEYYSDWYYGLSKSTKAPLRLKKKKRKPTILAKPKSNPKQSTSKSEFHELCLLTAEEKYWESRRFIPDRKPIAMNDLMLIGSIGGEKICSSPGQIMAVALKILHPHETAILFRHLIRMETEQFIAHELGYSPADIKRIAENAAMKVVDYIGKWLFGATIEPYWPINSHRLVEIK